MKISSKILAFVMIFSIMAELLMPVVANAADVDVLDQTVSDNSTYAEVQDEMYDDEILDDGKGYADFQQVDLEGLLETKGATGPALATNYDTLKIQALTNSKGKVTGVSISGVNGIVTVNTGVKVNLSASDWSIKGSYDGRVTSVNQSVAWNNVGNTKADIKCLKKYATVKYNKKDASTTVKVKSNKKVSGGVYAVKLVNEKGDYIYLNIENVEFHKSVKTTKMNRSGMSLSNVKLEQFMAAPNDHLKVIKLSLKGNANNATSFNNNAIVWKAQSGYSGYAAIPPEKVYIGTVQKGFGLAKQYALFEVQKDGSLRIFSGNYKYTAKFIAEINGKKYAVKIKIK